MAPVMLKPVPEMAAALTVTGAVPVDVRVSELVTGVFRVTLPNATLVALIPKVGMAAWSCRANDLETPLALAVRVAT